MERDRESQTETERETKQTEIERKIYQKTIKRPGVRQQCMFSLLIHLKEKSYIYICFKPLRPHFLQIKAIFKNMSYVNIQFMQEYPRAYAGVCGCVRACMRACVWVCVCVWGVYVRICRCILIKVV